MSVTLQVLYPVGDGTRFDHDYYTETHLTLVRHTFGAQLERVVASRIGGTPDGDAPEYHVIATLYFVDRPSLDAALKVADPVIDDIAQFTDTTPVMQVGETVG